MNPDQRDGLARYRLARLLLVWQGGELVGPRLACSHFYSLGCALRATAGPAFSPCPEADRACCGLQLELALPGVP